MMIAIDHDDVHCCTMTTALVDGNKVQPRRSMADVVARWQADLPELSNVCCTTDDDRRWHFMACANARWVTMTNDDEQWCAQPITPSRTRVIV